MSKVREFILDKEKMDKISDLHFAVLQNFLDLTKELVELQLDAQDLKPESEGDEDLLDAFVPATIHTALHGMDSLVEDIENKEIRDLFLGYLNDPLVKKAVKEAKAQQRNINNG